MKTSKSANESCRSTPWATFLCLQGICRNYSRCYSIKFSIVEYKVIELIEIFMISVFELPYSKIHGYFLNGKKMENGEIIYCGFSNVWITFAHFFSSNRENKLLMKLFINKFNFGMYANSRIFSPRKVIFVQLLYFLFLRTFF